MRSPNELGTKREEEFRGDKWRPEGKDFEKKIGTKREKKREKVRFSETREEEDESIVICAKEMQK